MTEKSEQLKDRDRVIVRRVEIGDSLLQDRPEEARGILISTKADNAYILPDGMKTIKVWPLDQVEKEPAGVDAEKAVIVAVLTFLADYYIQKSGAEAFSPIGKAKLECVNYLLQQEGVEKR